MVARMLVGALFGGRAAEAAPAVDLKVLHAKIGELTGGFENYGS